MGQIRRDVYFRGHVQGVGFRYNTQRLAQSYPVTGFVRNLDDGRVNLVVEGESEVIDLLLEQIQQNMEGFIRGMSQQTLSASGEFHGFKTRC